MDDPTLRKIELETVEDLRYLYENLQSIARSRIDVHLPPQNPPSTTSTTSTTSPDEQDEDPLRLRVRALINTYITSTFTLALPNLSINGLTPPPSTTITSLLTPATPEPEYEAYDRALHSKVQELQNQIEAQTLRVAKLRRDVPARAVKRWEKALERELGGDEEVIRGIVGGEGGEETRRWGGLGLEGGMEGVGRGEEVDLEEWRRGMEVLEGLKETLPATTHKLGRAQDALDYLRSKSDK
ncbi:hypothetical protein DFH27DRAFT_527700 [Peziza echinospora]|nr:hypothetical protein DFH27DRAFT_527700 [Peziza echinospora]